jgi:hypothetical protein
MSRNATQGSVAHTDSEGCEAEMQIPEVYICQAQSSGRVINQEGSGTPENGCNLVDVNDVAT